MIQFNLLPDVKLEYIRVRRFKRIVTLAAGAIAAGALIITILLFVVVNVLQRQHLNNLSRDIAADSKKLEETEDLDKILTVQNQLNNLTSLHSQKPQATRLSDYLKQITPLNANIAQIDVDFTLSSVSLSGSANSLADVNKFVDTLKFTKYTIGDTAEASAFTDVVLSSFGLDFGRASYLITFKFDPVIFDSSKEVKLVVPNTITTRSSTNRPEALFQPSANTQGGR